jgi:hypothetical protein
MSEASKTKSEHLWQPRKIIGYRCQGCGITAMHPHQNTSCPRVFNDEPLTLDVQDERE